MNSKESVRAKIWEGINKEDCTPFENIAREVFTVSVQRWLGQITNDEWWEVMECFDMSLTDQEWRLDVCQALKSDAFGFNKLINTATP